MRTREVPRRPTRMPTVTVVVPSHNYARFLPVSVRSATEQRGIAVDVIVVDDASTDDSVAVARALAAEDARISLVINPVNKGHIATYNTGLIRASGDYVVLLSADDVLAPGALARAAALMEHHPEVGIVYGYAESFSDRVPDPVPAAELWSIWPGEAWIARMCQRGSNTIVNPEAVMRRTLLVELGGYDPSLPQTADMDLWMRGAARMDVGRVNGPVQAFYREHGGNMHLTSFGGLFDEMLARFHTFEAFFQADGSRLPRASELRDTARRSMAREAVAAATMLTGGADDAVARHYAEFAVAAWPSITETGVWRRLQRRTRRAPSRLRRSIDKRVRYLRSALRWRRWRRFGT